MEVKQFEENLESSNISLLKYSKSSQSLNVEISTPGTSDTSGSNTLPIESGTTKKKLKTNAFLSFVRRLSFKKKKTDISVPISKSKDECLTKELSPVVTENCSYSSCEEQCFSFSSNEADHMSSHSSICLNKDDIEHSVDHPVLSKVNDTKAKKKLEADITVRAEISCGNDKVMQMVTKTTNSTNVHSSNEDITVTTKSARPPKEISTTMLNKNSSKNITMQPCFAQYSSTNCTDKITKIETVPSFSEPGEMTGMTQKVLTVKSADKLKINGRPMKSNVGAKASDSSTSCNPVLSEDLTFTTRDIDLFPKFIYYQNGRLQRNSVPNLTSTPSTSNNNDFGKTSAGFGPWKYDYKNKYAFKNNSLKSVTSDSDVMKARDDKRQYVLQNKYSLKFVTKNSDSLDKLSRAELNESIESCNQGSVSNDDVWIKSPFNLTTMRRATNRRDFSLQSLISEPEKSYCQNTVNTKNNSSYLKLPIHSDNSSDSMKRMTKYDDENEDVTPQNLSHILPLGHENLRHRTKNSIMKWLLAVQPENSEYVDEVTRVFEMCDRMDMQNQPGCEKAVHTFKILVIGDVGVGKTSIINRYMYDRFSKLYQSTIGTECYAKSFNFGANSCVQLQVWDLAGEDRAGFVTRVFYRRATGALLVFDVTRNSTYDRASKWKQDLDDKVLLSNGSIIPCVLLANKSDERDSQGEEENGGMKKYCDENGFITWFETSAKKGTNIDCAFICLISKMLQNELVLLNESKINQESVLLCSPSTENCERHTCNC